MESISAGLNWLNGIVWGVPMLILILGIGLYLTFGLRARSVTQVPLSLAFLWKGRHREGKGEITPFNALMTELAGKPMLVRSRRKVEPIQSLRKTVRAHYDRKRRHYGLLHPHFYDRDLRRLFSDSPEFAKEMKAARFIARIRYRVWGKYDSCQRPTPDERAQLLP